MTLVRRGRNSPIPTEVGNSIADLVPLLWSTCELRGACCDSFGRTPRILGAAKRARGAKERTFRSGQHSNLR